MKKTKIFISRNLGEDSPFRDALCDYDVIIMDQSLITFITIFFIQKSSDWLFFYSKTGVKYFLEQEGLIANRKIATFGPGTARFFTKKTEQVVDFIGSGERNDVAQKFASILQNDSCLFVVGKNSMRSVQQLITNKETDEVVVYDNFPKEYFEIESPDIAVFTSPMAVKSYFEKYPNRTHNCITIGETTHQSLLDSVRFDMRYLHLADFPSEKHLAQKALDIIEYR